MRIADGGSLIQTGGKGPDWRLRGACDLGLVGFSHLEITAGYGAGSLPRRAPARNEVLIADR